MMEKGEYLYANGKPIRGAGVHDLIDQQVFIPAGDSLFADLSQTFHFNTGMSAV